MKNYNQAPLPFRGQKRKFLKQFKASLKLFPNDAIYVDLFGGSGLLSQTVKSVYPNARVVWNDFDNYKERLDNIDKTNLLLADIRSIVKGKKKEARIDELRSELIGHIGKEKGFVDYITLSSSLLFSANYVTSYEDFIKENMYNNVKMSNYDATGYLEGVERVCFDYKELYNKFKDEDNVVFLVDPPYLSTDVSTYKNEEYWKIGDYLDVLKVIENKPYFYFTSEKSEILELAIWMSENGFRKNPFDKAVITEINTTLNKDAKYKDIMIYKH